jgi:hypothetical protein
MSPRDLFRNEDPVRVFRVLPATVIPLLSPGTLVIVK